MSNAVIYRALRKIEKGSMPHQKLKLICEKLWQMGFADPDAQGQDVKGYRLTISGKIFIWDYTNRALIN